MAKFYIKLTGEQENDLTIERIHTLCRDLRPSKSVQPFMSFPGIISVSRAVLHAYMRSDNSEVLHNQDFFYFSNKFGLDSPVASVTKRFAWYGNTEDVARQIEQLAENFGPNFKFDKDMFIPLEVKKPDTLLFGGALRLKDMKEYEDESD